MVSFLIFFNTEKKRDRETQRFFAAEETIKQERYSEVRRICLCGGFLYVFQHRVFRGTVEHRESVRHSEVRRIGLCGGFLYVFQHRVFRGTVEHRESVRHSEVRRIGLWGGNDDLFNAEEITHRSFLTLILWITQIKIKHLRRNDTERFAL